MKRIKDLSQLSKGCTITKICNGEFQQWEFLMIHPHNKNYILALNSWTQNGDKLYIPNILKEEYYVGKYDSCFVAQERIKQYERQIKRLQERIKQLQNGNENV
jgi:hypothetical protein